MNQLVKSIHHSASAAEMKLLDEAKKVLNGYDKEEIKKLVEMGFTNYKKAKLLDEKELNKSKNLINLIYTYKMCAPHYKFMTDDAVTELLMKYELVQGPIHRYIWDIPEKNQKELIDFKLPDKYLDHSYKMRDEINYLWVTKNGDELEVRDIGYKHCMNILRMVFGNYQKNLSYSHSHIPYDEMRKGVDSLSSVILRLCNILDIRNFSDFVLETEKNKRNSQKNPFDKSVGNNLPSSENSKRKEEFFELCTNNILSLNKLYNPNGAVLMGEILSKVNECQKKIDYAKPHFRIIAPSVAFDTTDMKMDDKRRLYPTSKPFEFVKIHIPDPIVQVKVNGGWLNVTAWGDEAHTDEAYNPLLN